VLNCHDETRTVTRYGRPYTGIRDRAIDDLQASDLALGRRRARAAALLLLALPGMANLYQGEELGLPEVEDLPEDALQDPVWERTEHAVRGRDGCRVPMPWSGEARPFGFGPAGSTPWLPQPRTWASLTADAQAADPASMLSLYRAALALRATHPGLAGEGFAWVDGTPDDALHFEREAGFRCLVNFGPEPLPLPSGAAVLLRSDGPTARGPLPQDAAAWYLAR
jgi:alpha-glucosidase